MQLIMTKFKRDVNVKAILRLLGHVLEHFVYTLKWENVVFVSFKGKTEDVYFVINLLAILAKCYFQKCKYSSQKPHFKHSYTDNCLVDHLIKRL